MEETVGATDRDLGIAEGDLTEDDLMGLYRQMVAIRTFETRAERLHASGALSGPFHSSVGQEAVAVGACSVLQTDDVITSTHRGHGHLIAKGARIERMLAELAGNEAGYCRGKSGSMHLVDFTHGAIGENGIVGASIFLGTGAALGFVLEGSDRIALAFFGDGAIGQGVLYECLNLASIWMLPIVFLCEDNGYAHSFASRNLPNGGDVTERARTFGMPAARVDGTDVLAVRAAVAPAVDRARAGGGPSLVQAICYRWKGHNLGDAHHLYRAREEVSAAKDHDPLAVLADRLRAGDPAIDLDAVASEAAESFDGAWRWASESSPSSVDLVFEDVT